MGELREPQDLNDPALRDRAVFAARGEAGFDTLLTGGMLADVATGELRQADIGLVGPLIASVHPPGTRGDAGISDRGGKNRRAGPDRFASAHRKLDGHAAPLCRGGGAAGHHDDLLGSARNRQRLGPVRRALGDRGGARAAAAHPGAGAVLRAVGAGAGTRRRRVRRTRCARCWRWPDIAGVAEVMDMRGVLERGAACGHRRCGAGEREAGLRPCPRPGGRGSAGASPPPGSRATTRSPRGEDLLRSCGAGLTVELRGSHDYVLPGAVEALNALPLMPQTLTICTDDVFPDDLVQAGGMIDVLRRLVRYGLAPMQALRCATLNAAMRRAARPWPGSARPARRPDRAVGSGGVGGRAGVRLGPAGRRRWGRC